MRRSLISVYLHGKTRLLFWAFVISAAISFPSMMLKISQVNLDNSPRPAVSYWNIFGPNVGAGDQDIDLFNNESTKLEDVPFHWCPLPHKANATALAGVGAIATESSIDCDALFAASKNDKALLGAAASWTPPCSYSDHEMVEIVCDCDTLKRYFYFESSPLSEEELHFPLAFVLVVEKNVEQVVRLLARIYQPQNLYCLTYDLHSNAEFKRSITCLSKCFRNIIMPDRHFEIYWADISILDATTACMRKMLSMEPQHHWRYVQILSWNDVPLRTNEEMVRIFKIMNGSCDSELTHGQPERYRRVHHRGGLDHAKIGLRRPLPPDGLTMYKGSYAVSLPREFCQFLFNDPIAQRLYVYSRHVWAPEEQFWSTLVHNPNLNHSSYFPGTCLHFYDMEAKEKAWVSRYQVWSNANCAGKTVSGSCCFGVGDLEKLIKKPSLVAHKVYGDFQPATLYCMLKWHHSRTYNASVAATFPLNVEYYTNLPAVRYQLLEDKDEFTC